MNGESHTVARSVSSTFSRIFGRSETEVPAIGGELARYSAAILAVKDVMLRHAIEPNPDNYALVYRHAVLHEPRLEAAMDELVRTGLAPRDTAPGLSDAEIQALVSSAQTSLAAIEKVVSLSSADTRRFSEELAGSAEAATSSPSGPAIRQLMDLTRAMIEKTRQTEEELQLRSKEMAGLKESLVEAQVKADTDALTGLSNRRAFERHLGAAGARAVMSGTPMTLAICDIDHFKAVNDTYGHDIGDRVLQFVSNVLQESCGRFGHVSRHGGEEFVIVLENRTTESAYEVVDGARRDLEQRHMVNKLTNEAIGTITFSAGIGKLDGNGDVGNLLRTADRALYKSKAAGRNCVTIGGAI